MDMNSGQKPSLPPEAASLLKDPAALKRLLQSREARSLIALLSQQNGAALQQAAQQAAKGDISSLNEMIGKATASQEGAKLAEELKRQAQGK